MMIDLVASAICAGVFATLALDIWQRLLMAVTGIPPTNWAMVGRWFGHMPAGQFRHDKIAQSATIPNELLLGWILHYVIGILYGLIYVGLVSLILSSEPTLLNGFIFGAVSVVIPWFVMQPGLGLGVMGARAPNPSIPRYTALVAHCLYGWALYGGWKLFSVIAN